MGEIYVDLNFIGSIVNGIVVKTDHPKSPDSSMCFTEASWLTCYTQRRTVTGTPVAQNP